MNLKNVTNYIVRTDTIDSYLKSIKGLYPMTQTEEMDMFAKYEDVQEKERKTKTLCDEASDATVKHMYAKRVQEYKDELLNIRNEIISRNLRFNFAVAKRYDNGENLPDLINVGFIGMCHAFNKFNWREGVRFCYFAIYYIRRSIHAYLIKENMTVRVKSGSKYTSKVKKIVNNFYLENGRNPSEMEVMDILKEQYGVEVSDITELYGVKIDYIDATVSDDDDNTFEKTPLFTEKTAVNNEYDSEVEDAALSYAMGKAMSCLSSRDATIVKMSCGCGYPKAYKDKEIAEELGYSSERIRQLRHAALNKMKKAYQAATAE